MIDKNIYCNVNRICLYVIARNEMTKQSPCNIENVYEKRNVLKKNCFYFFCILFLIGVNCLFADIKLPAIFASDMVLQRDSDITVFGWADPGEKVTVSFNSTNVSAVTGNDGKWQVSLGTFKAGGPFNMMIRGKNILNLKNILIGDVWLCSGQSNMEMKVSHCNNAAEEIAAAYHPNLRLFSITNIISAEPLDDCQGEWQISRPSTVGEFSATAYYFGRDINEELDVPVGLIHASWGGSAIDTWISKSGLEHNPELQPLTDYWKSVLTGMLRKLSSTIILWESGWRIYIMQCMCTSLLMPMLIRPNVRCI